MTELTASGLLSPFRKQFPELQGKDNADVTRALELALQIHAVRRDATLYLAAHLLAMAQNQVDAAGNIVNDGGGLVKTLESMAGQAVGFENPGATQRSAMLSTTTYGRTFILLERGSSASLGARVYG